MDTLPARRLFDWPVLGHGLTGSGYYRAYTGFGKLGFSSYYGAIGSGQTWQYKYINRSLTSCSKKLQGCSQWECW